MILLEVFSPISFFIFAFQISEEKNTKKQIKKKTKTNKVMYLAAKFYKQI